MLCLSFAHPNYLRHLSLLTRVDYVELRLDKIHLSSSDYEILKSYHKKIIAAYHLQGSDEAMRDAAMRDALANGIKIFDLDCPDPSKLPLKLMHELQDSGADIILSYHNWECTPDEQYLLSFAENAISQGAYLCKIATMVQSTDDLRLIMGLSKHLPRIMAIGMGEKGKISRIASLFLGAPFTYVAVDDSQRTAAGQFDLDTMEELLRLMGYGN